MSGLDALAAAAAASEGAPPPPDNFPPPLPAHSYLSAPPSYPGFSLPPGHMFLDPSGMVRFGPGGLTYAYAPQGPGMAGMQQLLVLPGCPPGVSVGPEEWQT